jgi:hypothetical protein
MMTPMPPLNRRAVLGFGARAAAGEPALAAMPMRVDCATSDRFYAATRQFVAVLVTMSLSGADNCLPS